MNLTKILTLAACGLACAVAQGQTTIVAWDTSEITSAQVTFAATFAATNITGVDISRGAGLGSTNADGTYASNGFSGTDADDFVTFGFMVADNFEASLGTLSLSTSTTNTGPGTLGLYYSGDDFSSILHTFNQSGTSTIPASIDLSSLKSLTGQILFRIVEINDLQADGVGATGTSGAFRIANLDLTGTVSAIPEPSTAALLGGVMALGLVVTQRRKRSA